jgi:hypothetical protein
MKLSIHERSVEFLQRRDYSSFDYWVVVQDSSPSRRSLMVQKVDEPARRLTPSYVVSERSVEIDRPYRRSPRPSVGGGSE